MAKILLKPSPNAAYDHEIQSLDAECFMPSTKRTQPCFHQACRKDRHKGFSRNLQSHFNFVDTCPH